MAVVINDFEVVSEPPADPPPQAASPAPAPNQAQAMRELERLLRRQNERLTRVRAY